MSTDYSHFTNLAFDNLFARGPAGSEVLVFSASGSGLAFPAETFFTAASNQIAIQPGGSGNSFVFTASNPGQATTLTIPDPGNSAATFAYLAATQTLTNKTISGSSNTLSNIGDSSLSVSYVKADGSRSLSATWDAGQPILHKVVTDGSSAATGYVGQIVTSFVSATSAPTNNQFGDLTSIPLTAGDWDIYLRGEGILNSSTLTEMLVGISTTSGNSATGLINGDTLFDIRVPTAGSNSGFCFGPFTIHLNSTVTYYFKVFASYSAGTPQFRGRIIARARR